MAGVDVMAGRTLAKMPVTSTKSATNYIKRKPTTALHPTGAQQEVRQNLTQVAVQTYSETTPKETLGPSNRLGRTARAVKASLSGRRISGTQERAISKRRAKHQAAQAKLGRGTMPVPELPPGYGGL